MTLAFSTSVPLMPSASIYIANQRSLKAMTSSAFGGVLPSSLLGFDKNRFRGDFLARDAVWGLRETSSDENQPFSTAVAMTGAELTFYIEPLGHGVGYLRCAPERTVFTRTIITISVTDLLRNTSESIEFRRFEDPENSLSRYFKWTIPESDGDSENLFSSDGVHGVYLLNIVEKSDFYLNPELSNELILPDGITPSANESNVQIRVYDWKKILNDVSSIGNYRNITFNSGVRVLTSYINPAALQTPNEVFDSNTYLPSFQPSTSAGELPLTNEQKSSVMMDNAMVLLSSQIPVLPSDSRLSTLMGTGMKTGGPISIQAQQSAVRTRAVSENINLTASRTFGLNGVVVCQNTYSDLKGLTSDRNQSGSVLSDPPSSFLIDSLSGNFGHEGVGMSLRGLGLLGVSGVNNTTPDKLVNITLGEDSLVLVGGVSVEYYNNTVKVKVEIIACSGRTDIVNYYDLVSLNLRPQ